MSLRPRLATKAVKYFHKQSEIATKKKKLQIEAAPDYFWNFYLTPTAKSLLNPPSSHLDPAGLQSRRRPDGILRRAHTRGPAHHATAGLWEPLPGEEVLLHHPLMSRAQGAGRRLASPSSPHLKLPAHEALSWVFAPPGGHSVVGSALSWWLEVFRRAGARSRPPNWQPSERVMSC